MCVVFHAVERRVRYNNFLETTRLISIMKRGNIYAKPIQLSYIHGRKDGITPKIWHDAPVNLSNERGLFGLLIRHGLNGHRDGAHVDVLDDLDALLWASRVGITARGGRLLCQFRLFRRRHDDGALSWLLVDLFAMVCHTPCLGGYSREHHGWKHPQILRPRFAYISIGRGFDELTRGLVIMPCPLSREATELEGALQASQCPWGTNWAWVPGYRQ
jgi:hypothetical protein